MEDRVLLTDLMLTAEIVIDYFPNKHVNLILASPWAKANLEGEYSNYSSLRKMNNCTAFFNLYNQVLQKVNLLILCVLRNKITRKFIYFPFFFYFIFVKILYNFSSYKLFKMVRKGISIC